MPHGEEHSNTLIVEVGGSPLPDDVAALLVGGYVDDSSNVPDLFVLRFSDEATTVIAKGGFEIGVPLRLLVQASGPGGPELLLSGEVTALEAEVTQDGLNTVVRGLDMSHRLFRGRRVEAYVNCSAADIARQVATRAGLQAGTIDRSGPVLEHVTQDGVNDWQLLLGLARQTGALMTVIDGALDFTTATQAREAPGGQAGSRQDPLVIERGVSLINLRATVTSADQVPDVEVRGWDMVHKRALVARAPAQTEIAKPSGASPSDLARKFAAPSYLASHPAFDQQTQCDAAAKSLAAHLAGGFAALEGTARGNPQIRSGTAVSLVGVGKPFDGRYTVSASRHEFSSELGYFTSFVVSNDSERSMYGVAAGAVAPPAHSTPNGVVTGVVSDLKDPEHLGRVKVAFPVLSDQYVSGWARTVQVGAGEKRGSVVLPEVGDEVLVAFGRAGFQDPYVLGGVYNGVDKPDKDWSEHVGQTDGLVKRRAFVSRTGMLVEFLESPDGEQVTISSNGGEQRVSLVQKPDAAIQIVSKGPVEVTAQQDVTVTTSAGDIAMKGNKVSIEATSELDLKGASVKMTGSASADIKAGMVKVAGDSTAELSGGAATTVRGGIVRIN